ncbi:SGNH/GDSL hydrolase family protein [Streptomyces cucumeris]|uniref:SGNH/GDSL hydrolase family protein n=1 Tax=Streptomyces cucumeris TaxID=2962890 RepID=UPI003D7251C1
MKLSRLTAAVGAFAVSAVLALTGAGTAHASENSAGPAFVALGDSYSSGVGTGSYDSSSGGCKRSSKAYPALWAASHSPSSFNFTACSGAKTADVLNNQLGPLNSGTGLVSISIGGNDAGFADVMTTCVLPGESACLSKIASARTFAQTTLPGRLDQVYNAISAKSPSAHVVVLGYPRFYKLNGSCILGLTEAERSAINGAADLLNSITAKRAADHGYSFADVTSRFSGHEICSGSAWLNSLTWPIDDSYHPNAAGHSGGYLPAFAAAV